MDKAVDNSLNREIVRWYLMVYPSSRRGLTDGLERELTRRRYDRMPLFDYFAPTFVEARENDGKIVMTQTALLFNYFFIHASERDIYRLKKNEPQYNFLPRVVEKESGYHYPYVTDETMRTLQWIARSYSDQLPVLAADPQWLVRGDRVRITKGQFKGIEARIVNRPRASQQDLMVFVENWMCVPLLHVRPNQYEVIGLSNKPSLPVNGAKLDNDRMAQALHEALCRHHRYGTTDDDRRLAREVLLRYETHSPDSDVQRCKLFALLLSAYTILGDKEKFDSLLGVVRLLLPAIKAEHSLALLLVALYGCTDSSIYHERAHALIAPWRREENPKRSKRLLINRLADYDACLCH